jgi:hypothetical protein
MFMIMVCLENESFITNYSIMVSACLFFFFFSFLFFYTKSLSCKKNIGKPGRYHFNKAYEIILIGIILMEGKTSS